MRIDGDKGYVTLYVDDEEGDYEEEVWFPIKFEVCGGCSGKGTHVHRAIDENGISPDEFAEDPEFAEAYFGGRYDVQCQDCGGNNVMPYIDEDAVKLLGAEKIAHLEAYYDNQEADAAYDAECAAERRMGA